MQALKGTDLARRAVSSDAPPEVSEASEKSALSVPLVFCSSSGNVRLALGTLERRLRRSLGCGRRNVDLDLRLGA
jgi:hypothetical protein